MEIHRGSINIFRISELRDIIKSAEKSLNTYNDDKTSSVFTNCISNITEGLDGKRIMSCSIANPSYIMGRLKTNNETGQLSFIPFAENFGSKSRGNYRHIASLPVLCTAGTHSHHSNIHLEHVLRCSEEDSTINNVADSKRDNYTSDSLNASSLMRFPLWLISEVKFCREYIEENSFSRDYIRIESMKNAICVGSIPKSKQLLSSSFPLYMVISNVNPVYANVKNEKYNMKASVSGKFTNAENRRKYLERGASISGILIPHDYARCKANMSDGNALQKTLTKSKFSLQCATLHFEYRSSDFLFQGKPSGKHHNCDHVRELIHDSKKSGGFPDQFALLQPGMIVAIHNAVLMTSMELPINHKIIRTNFCGLNRKYNLNILNNLGLLMR